MRVPPTTGILKDRSHQPLICCFLNTSRTDREVSPKKASCKLSGHMTLKRRRTDVNAGVLFGPHMSISFRSRLL